MSKSSTGSKIAISAIIGGAAGYVAGILTAPKSGKETRADIKDAASKAIAEAEKQLKRLHTDLDKTIIEAKAYAHELSGVAKKDLEAVIDAAAKTKERVRKVISSIHDGEVDETEMKKAIDDAADVVSHVKKMLPKHN